MVTLRQEHKMFMPGIVCARNSSCDIIYYTSINQHDSWAKSGEKAFKALVSTVREKISPQLPGSSLRKWWSCTVLQMSQATSFLGHLCLCQLFYQESKIPGTMETKELHFSQQTHHKTTKMVNKVVFSSCYHTMWKSLIRQGSREFSVWNQHSQAAVSHDTLTKPGIIWVFSHFTSVRDWI